MAEDGFELDGTFYRWTVTDNGKDLMLIDRFTQMPIQEFFATVEDNFDRGRAPILLAMIATSIRAEHPDWSVDRIARLVMDASLTDISFIGGDEEEPANPPEEAAPAAADERSISLSDDSPPSHTLAELSTSETLYAVQG